MGGQKKEYGKAKDGLAPPKKTLSEKAILKKLKNGEKLSYFNGDVYVHEKNGYTQKLQQRGKGARYLMIRGEIEKASGGYLKIIPQKIKAECNSCNCAKPCYA
jgi:hypothetical protein